MNEENKEALAAVRMIKEHCLSMDCDDCAIQFICYRYFTDGTPGDWSSWGFGCDGKKARRLHQAHAWRKNPRKEIGRGSSLGLLRRMDTLVFNGKTYKIPLGFALAMPEGVFATIIPRSSMGLKTDLIMANGQGLIDSDYRGEVCAIYRAINLERDFRSYLPDSDIHIGDRIAQIYFNEPVNLVVVYDEFPDEVRDTERGESGFGSTGK